MNENTLNKLFESARTQVPKTNFDKTSAVFISKAGVTNIGLLAKWAKLSTQLKVIIMIGTTALLTAGIVTLFSIANTSKEPVKRASSTINKKTTENFERVVSDDGSVKTTYFNDDKKVVNVVVDQKSTRTTNDAPEFLALIPLRSLETNRKGEKLLEMADENVDADSTKTISFTISKNTLDLELAEIDKLAKDAGIQFSYNMWVWKGRIKRCTISMKIDQGDGKYCQSEFTLSGKFTKTFGWVTDGFGHAISLID